MALSRRLSVHHATIPLGYVFLVLFRLGVTMGMPRNADDASNYLAGMAMSAGNWRLHGWIMAPDNYAPTDVLGIAVLTGLFGDHPVLMRVFEALIWAAIALAGIGLALRGTLPRHRLGTVGVALAVLVFGIVGDGQADSFVSTVASHGCTILLTLLAFGLATRPEPLGAGRAALLCGLIAIGSLADPIFVVIAALPLLAVALLGLPGCRRAMLSQIGAVLVGLVLGRLLLILNTRTGGFDSAHLTLVLASFPALLQHLAFAGHAIARLLGADFFGRLVNHVVVGGPYLALLRAPLLLAFAIVVWQGGRRMTQAVRRWPMVVIRGPDTALDALLWFSVALCIASTIMTTAIAEPSGARFFLPASVAGGVLIARQFGRQALPALHGAAVILGSLAVCLLSPGPVGATDEQALVARLRDHGLTHGYAGYWQGSISSVLSDRTVTVLALSEGPDGRISPFDWFCDRAWYRQAARDWTGPVFFIATTQPLTALDLREASVRRQFGPPADTLRSGRWDILIYHSNTSPP